MRFRLITRPPLPPVKAWFTIADDVKRTQTIVDLKRDICKRVPALEQELLSGSDIQLSIDDFDLLDEEEVAVVRENDIICITRCTAKQTLKRKASEEDILPSKRQKNSVVPITSNASAKKNTAVKVAVRPTAAGSNIAKPMESKSDKLSNSTSPEKVIEEKPEEESEEETSSDEESSSEDSSEEEMSSEESSDQESSESSESVSDSIEESTSVTISGPPSPKANTIEAHPAAGQLTQSKTSEQIISNPSSKLPLKVPPVPPGHGKPATRNRNARRRAKRLADKLVQDGASVPAIPVSTFSANATPLGERQAEAEPSAKSTPAAVNGITNASQFTSSSLHNKNKKNGFKRAMMNRTPQIIRFDSVSGLPEQLASTSSNVTQDFLPTSSTSLPRLLTPSERQANGDIPKNIFVTSIELEDDNWDRQTKKKRRDTYGYEDQQEHAANNSMQWHTPGDDFEHARMIGEEISQEVTGSQSNGQGDMTYGQIGEAVVEQKPGLNWFKIDNSWSTYATILDITVVEVGQIIGTLELAINPATFSPEFLATLSRVITIDTDKAELTVIRIPRASSKHVSFGAAEVDVEEEEEEEEAMEEQLPFASVLNGNWKIVDLSS